MSTNVPVRRYRTVGYSHSMREVFPDDLQMDGFTSRAPTLYVYASDYDALTAERDSLRADAQRLDWLETNMQLFTTTEDRVEFAVPKWSHLRAAIDSAIAATPLDTPAGGLNEQRDSLRADAERYRWFKSEYSATWHDAVTGSDGICWSSGWELRVYLPTADESQLDAAIDSAMKEQKIEV